MTPRTVFVTGASSGLGRGLAQHYARTGATVYAAARRRDRLDELARETSSSAGGGRVVPLPLDVSDSDALAAAVADAERDAGGALDLVVANAGVAQPTPGRKIDWRVVRQITDVNVTAACVTISAALPAMVARRSGSVVVVSSLAAFRGMPGNGAYSASKAAVGVFMESLRVDLRGTGVRAITIHPGFVKTEMTQKNRFPMPFLMELDDAVAAMVKGIAAGDPVIMFPRPLAAVMTAARAVPGFAWELLASRARTF